MSDGKEERGEGMTPEVERKVISQAPWQAICSIWGWCCGKGSGDDVVKPAPGGPLTPKERWELAREVIRHQDGLVNNRVTWFLVLQGFLLNAFVSGIGLFDKPTVVARGHATLYLTLGITSIALLGMYSSISSGNMIDHATEHGAAVRKWWGEPPEDHSYPAVARKWEHNNYDWLFSSSRLPYGFFWAWLLLLALFLVGALC